MQCQFDSFGRWLNCFADGGKSFFFPIFTFDPFALHAAAKATLLSGTTADLVQVHLCRKTWQQNHSNIWHVSKHSICGCMRWCMLTHSTETLAQCQWRHVCWTLEQHKQKSHDNDQECHKPECSKSKLVLQNKVVANDKTLENLTTTSSQESQNPDFKKTVNAQHQCQSICNAHNCRKKRKKKWKCFIWTTTLNNKSIC